MTTIENRNTYLPARLDSVRRKRMIAFLIDFTIVTVLWLIACIVVGILGVVTLGLAWLLYGAVFPVIAVLYSGTSISGRGATPGMRAVGLTFRLETGEQPGFLQGAIHVILFYVSVTFLTPLVLLVSLFNSRKRLLHDMLIGATVENA
jgi:uncharacterized RDD family membrane protein YckC